MEAQRRSAEAQLGGLRSALRRGLGLGRAPSPAPSPAVRQALGSPARSPPTRGELSARAPGGMGEREADLEESPPPTIRSVLLKTLP